MNHKELVADMAMSAKVTETVAAAVLKGFIAAVYKSVMRGNSVYVSEFGVFKLGKVKARLGVNPRTRAAIAIPASRVLRLQVSKVFKDRIN